MVQTRTVKEARARPWRWTPKRRQALRWMLKGHSDVWVAAQLGIHRNSLRRWRGRVEFQREAVKRMADTRTRLRFSRATEVGLVLDAVSSRIARMLLKLERGEELATREIAESRALVASYSNLRDSERIELQLIDATIADIRNTSV